MNALFLLTSKVNVATLNNNSTLRQGLEKMQAHGYTAIPVINDDGDYIGCVSEGDFLWHIIRSGEGNIKELENFYIRDIIRPGWNPAVKVDVSMDELLARAMNQNFIPVIDDRKKFIGIVTRKNIIAHFTNGVNNTDVPLHMRHLSEE